MNKLNFKDTWALVKGKLKQKYTQLTSDELSLIEQKEIELYRRLQQRLGKRSEEISKNF